ncbi:MAG: GGDEF domain-containing protein [Deinococcales bacterium]
MNGVAGGRARIDPQPSSRVPFAANRRALLRAAAALGLAAGLVLVFMLVLLRLYAPAPGYRAAHWMLALRSAFVVPPLLLFAAVAAGIAFIPKRLRVGALATTLGLTLWMTYELAAVLFAAPDTRGLTVELAIDALVVVGITAYLYGGLLEHHDLRRQAERDPLTGLFNRAGANRAWGSLPSGTPVILAVIDLNELKLVNDRSGHEAGDNLLLACAAELREIRGSSGFAARWGGDEFVLVLPGRTCDQTREQLGRASMRIPVTIGELPVWAIGTASAVAGASLREAMQPADADMYRHKAEQYLAAKQPHERPPASNESAS